MKFYIVAFLVAILSVVVSIFAFIDVGVIAAVVMRTVVVALVVVGFIHGWDKYVVREINTIEELKKGNVAYAIFIGCIAIAIGLAASGS